MRILLEALQAGRLFELTETSKKGAFEFLGRVLEAIPEIPDDSGVVEAMLARGLRPLRFHFESSGARIVSNMHGG